MIGRDHRASAKSGGNDLGLPSSAKTEASVRGAETLQRRADHAKEVRDHIMAAAGALAAIAQEVVLLNHDRETGHEKSS